MRSRWSLLLPRVDVVVAVAVVLDQEDNDVHDEVDEEETEP